MWQSDCRLRPSRDPPDDDRYERREHRQKNRILNNNIGQALQEDSHQSDEVIGDSGDREPFDGLSQMNLLTRAPLHGLQELLVLLLHGVVEPCPRQRQRAGDRFRDSVQPSFKSSDGLNGGSETMFDKSLQRLTLPNGLFVEISQPCQNYVIIGF